MIRLLYVYGLILMVLLGCKEEVKDKPQDHPYPKSYLIKGYLSSNYIEKVFLNSIESNSLKPIDSAMVVDGIFEFSGQVNFPLRHAITFAFDPSVTTFILENCTMEMVFEKDRLEYPIVTGSPLNDLYMNYQKEVRSIFKQIDVLYPEFQRARLENDAAKLNAVSTQMKSIEKDYFDYSIGFIETHSNSYLAAIVLNDLMQADQVKPELLMQAYKVLADHVKKTEPAQEVAKFLELP